MSIKGQTKKDRESSVSHKVIFNETSEIPSDKEHFLKNSENKIYLNLMILIAKYAVDPLRCDDYKVCATQKDSKVLLSPMTVLESCSIQDNRMMFHIKDMILNDNITTIQ